MAWTYNVVGHTIYSEESNDLSITSCDEGTWLTSINNKGNQVQMDEDLSGLTNFEINFRIGVNDNVSGALGQFGAALVDSNNKVICSIGYADENAANNILYRWFYAENTINNKNAAWNTSAFLISGDIYKTAPTSDDYMDVTIRKNGNVITVSTSQDGVIGQFTLSSTVKHFALVTARYSNYVFMGTGQLSNLTSDFGFSFEATKTIKSILRINDENYNNWKWQNEIPITGSPYGELFGYCVNIIVPYAPNFMNYNFSDIRFGTDYGLNIPYFLRRKVDGEFAEFIARIPHIPQYPDVEKIYLYAGYDDAVDRSDGLKTFDLFDPFDVGLTPTLDMDKWTETAYITGSATLNDSILTVFADLPGNWETLTSKASFNKGYILGFRAKYRSNSDTSSSSHIGLADSTGNYYIYENTAGNNQSQFQTKNNDTPELSNDHTTDYPMNEYHNYEIEYKDVIKEYIDFNEVANTNKTINQPLNVIISNHGYAQARYTDIDYIYMRRSIGNEPSIGELGTWATTQHTTIYPATLEIPYWEDFQALLCIRPLRADFKATLNITGSGEELIPALLTINEDKANNYINIYPALLEINANASNKDVKATLNIGNVLSGSMEVHGKILYNYNQNPLEQDKNDNKNVQFVMNLGGRIYG